MSSDPLIRDVIGLWPEETLPRHPVILLAARCRRLQRQARKTATMPLVARRNDEGSGIVLTPTWMMPLLQQFPAWGFSLEKSLVFVFHVVIPFDTMLP